MTTTRQRNQRIVEMRAQGVTRQEIARLFGITPGRLFPIRPGMTLAVECAGQRVEAFLGADDRRR